MTLLIIILIIVLISIIIKIIIKMNIEIDNFTCKETKQAISDYPKTYNLDPLFNGIFKLECCPSPYSSSKGCLCDDVNTTELIKNRGGNRIMC
jgi:hypothetical protein